METRSIKFKCDICGKRLINIPGELKHIYLACTEHDVNGDGLYKVLYRGDACNECYDIYWSNLFANFPHVDKILDCVKVIKCEDFDNDLDTYHEILEPYDGGDLDN